MVTGAGSHIDVLFSGVYTGSPRPCLPTLWTVVVNLVGGQYYSWPPKAAKTLGSG